MACVGIQVNLLELFSGIGGFSKGLSDAGFVFNKHYFSEVDKHAIANYKYNFKKSEYVGSVTDVRGWGIERPNIITFGSPCQDFSLAGKGKGLDGDKSSLIKFAIMAIERFRPDVFIWENVKGAYSTNDSADYWAIIQAFTNIDGYRCETQLLNTAWLLPQNRERIYLVGHLTDRSKFGVFPIGEGNIGNIKGQTKAAVVRAITAGGHSGGHHSGMTLINANTKKGFEEANEGDSINFSVPTSKTRRGRVGKGVAQTLDTQCNQGVIQVNTNTESGDKQPYQQNRVGDYRSDEGFRWRENSNSPTLQARAIEDGSGQALLKNKTGIRRLTEIECERLQGFPDDWTKFGDYDGVVKAIPKTQRYKMCGNAVTVDVVRVIAERLNLLNF